MTQPMLTFLVMYYQPRQGLAARRGTGPYYPFAQRGPYTPLGGMAVRLEESTIVGMAQRHGMVQLPQFSWGSYDLGPVGSNWAAVRW